MHEDSEALQIVGFHITSSNHSHHPRHTRTASLPESPLSRALQSSAQLQLLQRPALRLPAKALRRSVSADWQSSSATGSQWSPLDMERSSVGSLSSEPVSVPLNRWDPTCLGVPGEQLSASTANLRRNWSQLRARSGHKILASAALTARDVSRGCSQGPLCPAAGLPRVPGRR